jgi:hypothetical protein
VARGGIPVQRERPLRLAVLCGQTCTVSEPETDAAGLPHRWLERPARIRYAKGEGSIPFRSTNFPLSNHGLQPSNPCLSRIEELNAKDAAMDLQRRGQSQPVPVPRSSGITERQTSAALDVNSWVTFSLAMNR